MLNRRLLRIKAFQRLYACQRAQASSYQLAEGSIEEAFPIVFSSEEVIDREGILARRQQAQALYRAHAHERYLPPEARREQDEGVVEVVNSAISRYTNSARQDYLQAKKQLLADTDNLQHRYYALLWLLVELASQARSDVEDVRKALSKLGPIDETPLRFHANPVIGALRQHPTLREAVDRHRIDWDPEQVRKWYGKLKTYPPFLSYLGQSVVTDDEHREWLRELVRQLFREPTFQAVLEAEDLNWHENRTIVRTLLLKTLNNIGPEHLPEITDGGAEPDPEATAEPFALFSLSPNWEDDRAFLVDLFTQTYEQDAELEALIGERIHNWAVDRVALTDRIILKLAVCELLNFTSIPVKVTINEYLDIAKVYSTPKSQQFVNGLLDRLVADLTADGRIKKSGRGLLDNQ